MSAPNVNAAPCCAKCSERASALFSIDGAETHLCARCTLTALAGKKCNLCGSRDGELIPHGRAAWTHAECDARRANRWVTCCRCHLRTDAPIDTGIPHILHAYRCAPCDAKFREEERLGYLGLRERDFAKAGTR